MHRELAQSEGEDIGKGWVYVGRHITHEELGMLIGAKRETVTVYLNKLRDAGSFKQVGREGFKVKPLDLQED